MQKTVQLTLFFDGTCPLCVKEIRALELRDKEQKLAFVDIEAKDFAEHYPMVSIEKARKILHGLTDNGDMIYGLDVCHRAWQLLGKGWLYGPSRWPIIKPLADRAYLFFASNRYAISRVFTGQARCDNGNCKL